MNFCSGPRTGFSRCLQTVLNARFRAMILEAASQALRHAEPLVDLPQEQYATVRRQPTAVETSLHPTAAQTFKTQLLRDTLWLHGTAP